MIKRSFRFFHLMLISEFHHCFWLWNGTIIFWHNITHNSFNSVFFLFAFYLIIGGHLYFANTIFFDECCQFGRLIIIILMNFAFKLFFQSYSFLNTSTFVLWLDKQFNFLSKLGRRFFLENALESQYLTCRCLQMEGKATKNRWSKVFRLHFLFFWEARA